jgi:3-hydroxyacyl-[acyl-carrier-protein] dehydratase
MTCADGMTDLQLPLDQVAIQRVLPHRYPFLFVDRIVALEPDRRIVGEKSFSLNDHCLVTNPFGPPAVPAAVLVEAVAQVGAILILIKPENRDKLVFFMGINRLRFRGSVHAGDTVEIEANVRLLRERMGRFRGTARVRGRVVAEGSMSYVLGSAPSREDITK